MNTSVAWVNNASLPIRGVFILIFCSQWPVYLHCAHCYLTSVFHMTTIRWRALTISQRKRSKRKDNLDTPKVLSAWTPSTLNSGNLSRLQNLRTLHRLGILDLVKECQWDVTASDASSSLLPNSQIKNDKLIRQKQNFLTSISFYCWKSKHKLQKQKNILASMALIPDFQKVRLEGWHGRKICSPLKVYWGAFQKAKEKVILIAAPYIANVSQMVCFLSYLSLTT